MAKRKSRPTLSISGPIYTLLRKWCDANKVPLSAVVEILSARAIGMPLDHLPERTARWADKLPITFTAA